VQLYLPIADIPVNVCLILRWRGGGFVSGMFGIGGGFLMDAAPDLRRHRRPPSRSPPSPATSRPRRFPARCPTGAAAPSIRRWRWCCYAAGIVGTTLGVWTFTLLRSLGQLDLMIALSYVALLNHRGGLMFWEGLRAILRARRGITVPMRRSGSHGWIHGLPLKMRFKRSKIYLSVIPVVAVGVIIGFIGAGDGHRRRLHPGPDHDLSVAGADLDRDRHLDGAHGWSPCCSPPCCTQSTNHLVDAVLALILMVGGVTGAQFGARAGQKIPRRASQAVAGLLILAVRHPLAIELVLRPDDLFTIGKPEAPDDRDALHRRRSAPRCWARRSRLRRRARNG